MDLPCLTIAQLCGSSQWMSCHGPGSRTGPVGCAKGWYRQELLNMGTRMILHGGETVSSVVGRNACLLSL